MNLWHLFVTEMQLYVLIGVPVTILGSFAMWAWAAHTSKSKKLPKPKGPHIRLDTPCPACGNQDCELAYDAEKRHVKRRCKVCGCVVEQPPVAPHLFEKK